MSTELPQDDIHSFYEYLGRRIERGERELSPEESVREYRAYREELQRFMAESQSSFAQAKRGEHGPIDVDAVMERVSKRLSEKGRDQ